MHCEWYTFTVSLTDCLIPITWLKEVAWQLLALLPILCLIRLVATFESPGTSKYFSCPREVPLVHVVLSLHIKKLSLSKWNYALLFTSPRTFRSSLEVHIYMIIPRGKNGNALPQRLSMQTLFFRLLYPWWELNYISRANNCTFHVLSSTSSAETNKRLLVMAILRSCVTSTPRQIHLAWFNTW